MIRIKKYPNRRLYDTQRSAYINLDEIKAMVLAQVAFCVEDSKTGEDLTKSTLLHIIAELETSPEQSLLTETVLRQLICFYGSEEQALFRRFMETMMLAFRDRRDSLRTVFTSLMELNAPAVDLGKSFREQLEVWNRWIFKDR